MPKIPYADYRFLAICLFSTMGLIGIVRKHVGSFESVYIVGEEAVAFGVVCFTVSGALIFLDVLKARQKNKNLESD